MHKRTSHGIVDSTETDAVTSLEVEMTGKLWRKFDLLIFLFAV